MIQGILNYWYSNGANNYSRIESKSDTESSLESETSSDSIDESHTLNWGFLDYVEHLLVVSRSIEASSELNSTNNPIFQSIWSKIDDRANLLHRLMLHKAEKIYKKGIKTVNIRNNQDILRNVQQYYFNIHVNIKLLNKPEFSNTEIKRIDLKTLIVLDSENCQQFKNKKSNKITPIEAIYMEAAKC
ncbi:hypothetical protein cand_038240 [Cryptosporidium andersoni]|uniref:Uncharacterized protein n=1 Tax=Cryptosporidium andersoni TaxID=117008 RepID=A0A1J4MYB2_9CRYT|nr:hypothetical protein cand_038240 [Cryptosporidium andersoni]